MNIHIYMSDFPIELYELTYSCDHLNIGSVPSTVQMWQNRFLFLCSASHSQYTGCPVKLSALRFCYFLGFQSTYRRTSGHFSIAQEMRISKLTLLSFLCEKLIELQNQTWDKLDFESTILMADFASFLRGLPTLGSIISVIFKAIFKILVPILLQISWIFRNSPNI